MLQATLVSQSKIFWWHVRVSSYKVLTLLSWSQAIILHCISHAITVLIPVLHFKIILNFCFWDWNRSYCSRSNETLWVIVAVWFTISKQLQGEKNPAGFNRPFFRFKYSFVCIEICLSSLVLGNIFFWS